MACGPDVGPRRKSRPRRWQERVPALVACLVAALTGCAGDGPPPSTGGEYDAIQAGIFDVSCVRSGCHDVATQAGGLVLEAGLSFGNLVDVLPENATARQRGLRRVEPFDAAASFILIKLTGPGPGEGALMPLAEGMLPAAEIDQIRAWIIAGAPPPATLTPTAPAPTVTASPSPLP